MPRINPERSYDDITYRAEGNRIDGSGSFSPFTFLCISLILTLLGLTVLYSASYTKAIAEDLPHFFYFMRQGIAAAVSVVLSVILTLIPMKKLEKGYIVLAPAALAALILALIPGFSYGGMLSIGGHAILQPESIALLSSVFTIAGLIADKEERTTGRLAAAYMLLAATDCLILFSGGLSWYILSSLLMLLMLRRAKVPASAILIAFLFMAVTAFGASFLCPELLSPLFSSMLPVPDPELYDQALSASRKAIADGGIAGVGLGSSLYKLGGLESPEALFIFSVFSEELGIVGSAFLVMLFVLYLIIGMRTSRRGMEQGNAKAALLSYGLSLMIVLKALFNMLYVLGVLPLPGILLPFFSYSVSEEAVTMLSSVILYRLVYMMGRKHES